MAILEDKQRRRGLRAAGSEAIHSELSPPTPRWARALDGAELPEMSTSADVELRPVAATSYSVSALELAFMLFTSAGCALRVKGPYCVMTVKKGRPPLGAGGRAASSARM